MRGRIGYCGGAARGFVANEKRPLRSACFWGLLYRADFADKFNAFGCYLLDIGRGVCVLHLTQRFDMALVLCPAAFREIVFCTPFQAYSGNQRNHHEIPTLRRCPAQYAQEFSFFIRKSHCSVLSS